MHCRAVGLGCKPLLFPELFTRLAFYLRVGKVNERERVERVRQIRVEVEERAVLFQDVWIRSKGARDTVRDAVA